MTISTENREAGPFEGNGVTVLFPFAFKVFEPTDLWVVSVDATDVETTLVYGTDYSVTLNLDQNSNAGGSITLTVPLPVGTTMVITTDLEALQPVDLTNQGGFYPSVINTALDRLTILVQQLAEGVARAAKVPITSDVSSSQLVEDIIILVNRIDDLDTLVAHITEIETVADNLNDPNSSIDAVAGSLDEINAIYDYIAQIVIVGNNIADVITTADNIADLNSIADNIVELNAIFDNLAAILAVPGYLAAAGLPPSLVGHAGEFLKVKLDETGYEFTNSSASPRFYGFAFSADSTELLLTEGRDEDYIDGNYVASMLGEGFTVAITNNQLVMTL